MIIVISSNLIINEQKKIKITHRNARSCLIFNFFLVIYIQKQVILCGENKIKCWNTNNRCTKKSKFLLTDPIHVLVYIVQN